MYHGDAVLANHTAEGERRAPQHVERVLGAQQPEANVRDPFELRNERPVGRGDEPAHAPRAQMFGNLHDPALHTTDRHCRQHLEYDQRGVGDARIVAVVTAVITAFNNPHPDRQMD